MCLSKQIGVIQMQTANTQRVFFNKQNAQSITKHYLHATTNNYYYDVIDQIKLNSSKGKTKVRYNLFSDSYRNKKFIATLLKTKLQRDGFKVDVYEPIKGWFKLVIYWN